MRELKYRLESVRCCSATCSLPSLTVVTIDTMLSLPSLCGDDSFQLPAHKCRYGFKSENLMRELKHMLENVQAPLTSLLSPLPRVTYF